MTWNFLKRFKKRDGRQPPCSHALTAPKGSSKVVPGLPPGTFTQTPGGRRSALLPPKPNTLLTVASRMDSIVIEANDTAIMEAWDTQEAMVDRPIGALGFAAGIAYIMTKGGWVNIGEALEEPLEMTDRRGAIRAQKARNGTRS